MVLKMEIQRAGKKVAPMASLMVEMTAESTVTMKEENLVEMLAGWMVPLMVV